MGLLRICDGNRHSVLHLFMPYLQLSFPVTEDWWSRSTNEQEMHINCLELLAACLAIQTFAKERQNINILVRTDNVSARAYINHFGGTH